MPGDMWRSPSPRRACRRTGRRVKILVIKIPPCRESMEEVSARPTFTVNQILQMAPTDSSAKGKDEKRRPAGIDIHTYSVFRRRSVIDSSRDSDQVGDLGVSNNEIPTQTMETYTGGGNNGIDFRLVGGESMCAILLPSLPNSPSLIFQNIRLLAKIRGVRLGNSIPLESYSRRRQLTPENGGGDSGKYNFGRFLRIFPDKSPERTPLLGCARKSIRFINDSDDAGIIQFWHNQLGQLGDCAKITRLQSGG